MSKVYSEQIEKTSLLLEGLKNNQSILKQKGISADFIEKLESDNNQAIIYNDENDRLKADLKVKTVRANRKLDEIKAMVKEVKKIIKQDFPQEKWRNFGIMDKR
ncbi:hypothetical protein LJB97_04220 [Parabacteroides sp. OttesenSCG-928-O15]|nr:hypothetical protein [Parabacteroides sp. OttesenSCG-928-O15]